MLRASLLEINVFLAVARTGSFSRAAETLHMAQPTVSKWVRRLEDGTGLKLFDRTSRQVRLTPAGEYLAERWRPLVEELDAALANARELSKTKVRVLRLGALEGCGFERILPGLVTAFERENPAASVDLSLHTLGELTDELDGFDLVLTQSLEAGILKGHEVLVLDEVPLFLAVPRSGELAARGAVKLSELGDETFEVLSPKFSPDAVDFASGVFRRAGITPRISLAANPASQMLRVGLGQGVAFATRETAAASQASVALVEITEPPIAMKRILAWRTERMTGLTERLRDFMGAHFTGSPAL